MEIDVQPILVQNALLLILTSSLGISSNQAAATSDFFFLGRGGRYQFNNCF